MKQESLLLVDLALHKDLVKIINTYRKQTNNIYVYSSEYLTPVIERNGVKPVYSYKYRGSLKNILNIKLILFSFFETSFGKIIVNSDKLENIKYVFFTLLLLKGKEKWLYIDGEIIRINLKIWLKSILIFIIWFLGMIIEFIGSGILLSYLILRNKIDKHLL